MATETLKKNDVLNDFVILEEKWKLLLRKLQSSWRIQLQHGVEQKKKKKSVAHITLYKHTIHSHCKCGHKFTHMYARINVEMLSQNDCRFKFYQHFSAEF